MCFFRRSCWTCWRTWWCVPWRTRGYPTLSNSWLYLDRTLDRYIGSSVSLLSLYNHPLFSDFLQSFHFLLPSIPTTLSPFLFLPSFLPSFCPWWRMYECPGWRDEREYIWDTTDLPPSPGSVRDKALSRPFPTGTKGRKSHNRKAGMYIVPSNFIF